MESEKQTLTIANPFFDVTFKDLFGPQGSVVNGISSEERLLSLINEIIDDQQFTNIEFFDNPRNIFIITCKCWSDHSPYIYCIGFQKHLLPQNKDQFIVDGTHLVKDVADTVSYFTHFRIISILNRAGIPATLRQWHVDCRDLPQLAAQGITKGRADNNPVKLTSQIIENVLKSVY